MSDESLFTPFEPSPSIQPDRAETPKKRGRKPKAESEAQQSRKRNVASVNTQSVEQPTKRQRKPRKVSSVRQPRGLKLPVQMTLAAVGELRQPDVPVFEKLLGILSGAAKGQRRRVLAALGKVFA